MKITRIEIPYFRHLKQVDFDFGKIITVIAGGNGIGKTSILGIIGHIFRYGNAHKNLFNERFETKYSSVFRFSKTHDAYHEYGYKLLFDDGSSKSAELRVTNESRGIRHRIDVGGRVRGGGKVIKPVIFLSLKRLFPLAQENEYSIRLGYSDLTQDLIDQYNEIYNAIFSSTENITPVHTKSNNKNTYSPTTSTYDAHGISAGQDNIGHIILALLSFYQLKQSNPDYNGGLLLIDEVDATLYPAAQKNLLKILLEKGRELNLQIVFTTHSSDILNFLSSRNSSNFKHCTNFVCLSNSLGLVSVKQGHKELLSLLADLNHDAVRTIKPRKTNFYFEDSEACLFYKGIVDSVDFCCEKEYKDLSLPCGIYTTLIKKGFEEFYRSVVVLDGDVRGEVERMRDPNNIVLLPGDKRPENVLMDFLNNLDYSDSFWDNKFGYSKRVFIDKKMGVNIDDRDSMKKWFKSQLCYWGDDGVNLFNRWKEVNPEEAQIVIGRTEQVIKQIMDTFYEQSTYNM